MEKVISNNATMERDLALNTEFCYIQSYTDKKLRKLDDNFSVEMLSTGILLSRKARDSFFLSKSEIDRNYNAIVDFIISNIDNFTPFFATHNEASINTILDSKHLSGKYFWLGQLYGVGDHISLMAVKKGARVCKYLPYGPFEKSLPYLLRRIEENAVSVDTFRNENTLVRKEILSRIMGK